VLYAWPATYTVSPMLFRMLLLALSPALFVACRSGHGAGGQSGDPQALIQAAMSSPAGTAAGLEELFPRKPESRPCAIHGGGPPPGLRIPATCETRVQSGSGSALVSFVETWDGRRFHGPGSAAKPGLSHTWEFHLNGSNNVTSSRSFGDFPPQSVK
jgi:hypothetical protein